MSILQSKLQLLGITCLFIAAKYEEIYPPGATAFADITDTGYTKQHVKSMEFIVLTTINFDVSIPTASTFLSYYCHLLNMSSQALNLAMFIAELSLLDANTFLKFTPSVIAASSVVLARHTIGLDSWPNPMINSAGYNLTELTPCVVDLYQALTASTLNQPYIREKYMHHKFGGVACLSPVNIM